MQHRLFRFHIHLFNFRSIVPEELLALFLALFIFIVPVSADTRFETRGLYMQSSEPSATTSYTVSLQYMTPQPVGSLDMLFCIDPIPYMPCVTPPGLDVSNAALTAQTGETGFAILNKSPNHIILTRLPSMIMGGSASSYKLDNIVNPSQANQAFSIRLKSLGSIDGSGSQIDFGSVRGQVQTGTVIETQVPPMLIFCAARVVEDDCIGTDDTYYTDMGTLSAKSTLTAQSQMAVGTNATGGFAITANGSPLAAGTHTIDSPTAPTPSVPGTDQFGINLVANNEPSVGINPQGTWANAVTSPDYGVPNQYKYVSGDVVAYSPNVSLMKKFTVSYILNSSPSLHAGVYTTTITYIASGRF
ncbi:MAG: hypothetical protein JWO99_809 [Candidatus Saccharibacteria bacterium]|nr:hypothetical protein [Candidatus Saccharibacteria bacterium]